MGVLIFKLETSGLPIKGQTMHSDGQPRIIELAWSLFNMKGEEVGSGLSLNSASGIASSKEAFAIHGISDRSKILFGVDPRRFLALFMGHLAAAGTVASFNLPFDMQMLARELRLVADDGKRLDRPGMKRVDLMRQVTDFYSTGRFARLDAAHEIVLGAPYMVTHRARPDCDAAARIFWRLVTDGKIKL